MSSEHNSQGKENFNEEIELNSSDSIDAFIRELEAKERDLHISKDAVVEIEEIDIEDSDVKELERLIEGLQNKAITEASSFTNSGNNYFPHHQAVTDNEKELTQLRSEVAKLTLERTELNEASRQRQLEFENFRKRIERERSEIFRNLLCNLAMKMLPVVDNLNRALDSTANYPVEKTNDFQQFIDGIGLVNHQLSDVLEEMGIQPILSVGENFNPHFHEAVAMEQTSQIAPNIVMKELQRGYSIGEKVIRHSMVKVSAPANPENNFEEIILDTETD
jgi:molecular chaperone GrpE